MTASEAARLEAAAEAEAAWMADCGRRSGAASRDGRPHTSKALSCGHTFGADHGLAPEVGDIVLCLRCDAYVKAVATRRTPAA